MTDATTDPRPTPLRAAHEALGATLVPFAGWLMPLRYTSDLAEHTAVRTAAGLFDLSHMGEIGVRGPGAAGFLDLALVGNLSALRVTGARYTMICAADGGVIDDLIVYRLAEDDYMVVANAANHDVVLAELAARATGLEVTITDDSPATALVAVQGPRALEIVEALPGLVVDPELGVTPATLKYYAFLPVTVDGTPGLLARTGYTGEDGFEFFVPGPVSSALWAALLATGEPFGLVPAGLAARDSLRLEAGMPLYGHELDRTTTPYDAGLGRVVKLDKIGADGAPIPFVGREPLAARAQQPGTRTLVGLEGLGRRAARDGYAVLADGAPVGAVTSGMPSPTLGHPIAMAYVPPELSEPGTQLAVDVRGRAEPVRVVALPFYRRAR
ncbi:glycine cleavage system aminomethyltransferase GcvT [Cellulomonas citrea]|uniref:glycine cleavage system aminomethyltransferase GcvT n=1 Tax=Cellulomonas citrea TaxID=1909423 RepID=UPI0013599342|nr:glycine cleavage system aminomethyltransferase GcvT [Cellulomonas citrea]